MKNITVILPVHTLDGTYSELFENAVSTIDNFHNDVKLIVVGPPKVKEQLVVVSDKIETVIIENNGQTDFCSQINLAVNNCDTEWFTILEIDDEFTPNWLKFVNEYKNEHNDVDVFLPITKEVNPEGKFIGYTNEAVWAQGFCDEQGFVLNETLLDFQNFQTSGGLFKTDVFKNNGGLKENIKLTFTYELLLRLTHNGVKIMVIPHVGYRHVNLRDDSLFWLYTNNENMKLTPDETKFWVNTAKKEFFFKNKRDIEYVAS